MFSNTKQMLLRVAIGVQWFCFWRFIKDGATLYYHKKTKRFATKIQNSLYDINGLVQLDSDWVEWNSVDKEIHNEISKIINA